MSEETENERRKYFEGWDINKKFDFQLSAAKVEERKLENIFTDQPIATTGMIVELKTESWQWIESGNICIEFKNNGELSGISVTTANYWVHQLRRNDQTVLYLMFPTERLKELARAAIKAGQVRHNVGDKKLSSVALIKLSDVLTEIP